MWLHLLPLSAEALRPQTAACLRTALVLALPLYLSVAAFSLGPDGWDTGDRSWLFAMGLPAVRRELGGVSYIWDRMCFCFAGARHPVRI